MKQQRFPKQGSGHLKRRTLAIISLGLLITILFLSPLQFASPSGLQNEAKPISIPRVHEELSNLSDKQAVNQGNALKIFYSNGSSQILPIDYNGPLALSTINVGNSSTTMIFVNNHEKIDRTLLNVTDLNHHGYLVNNKVRVIILVGEQITSEAYVFSNVPSTHKESVISAAKELNGSIETMYTPYLPLIAVTVPYGKIFDLASHVSVAHVWLDIRYRVYLDESVPLIKDPARWSAIEANYGSAINGSGVKIAILDTGIDSNHPDFFFPNGTSKIIANVSFVPDETTRDGHGHGTHCASIATGTGRASSGKYVGVAHDALLMAVKVLNNTGLGYDSWVISGIQWAVNHSANILSMSFGDDVNDDGSDPMSLAVDWAVDNGAVCCVAAGNAGPSKFTVGIPAVSKQAITVGASTKQDEIVGFSSRGPSADLRIKPDVMAPGFMIAAARASGTSMGSSIDENYTRASGTSMATPHVAGAAALLLQMHPNWTPLYVKAALMNWAKSLDSVDVLTQGAGRIDCSNSANATALIIQPSLSFGIFTQGQTENTKLTFINLVDSPLTAYLSTNTTFEGGNADYVHTNVTTVSLPANENATVRLQVGPIDANASEGWYQGQLTVELSNGQKGGTPYFFVVFSGLAIDQTFVSDERCDVDSTQTICFHARWGCNTSDIIGGSIFINGTEYVTNGTGWISFEEAYSTVGKRQWTVTGISYRNVTSYYQFARDPCITWDRVQITLNLGNNRINFGSNAIISWNGHYEYDNTNFNGSISLNDTTIKDDVGKYAYTVKNILDPVYNLTAFKSNSVNAIFDKVSITLSAADSRIDAGSEATILWNGIHKYDGTLFNGTVTFNGTLTKSEVGRYGYTVSGINGDTYGITAFESNSVSIIFDRMRITEGGVSSSHCQVGLTQTVWLRAEYEYDSVRFDGTKGILFLNGEPMDWSDENSRWEYLATSSMIDLQTFKVTSVSDKAHLLTAVNDLVGEKSILWDEIEIKEITVHTTIFGVTKVKVIAIYTSTKAPVTGATVTVNGIKCTETETGVYMCETQDWSLTRKLNVQVDLLDFTETTATELTIHTMNLTTYLATLSTMVASIIVILLKKRRL